MTVNRCTFLCKVVAYGKSLCEWIRIRFVGGRNRYFVPVQQDRESDKRCAIVVSIRTVRNAQRMATLARWIKSDARDTYFVVVVGGNLVDVPNSLYSAVIERGGSIWSENIGCLEDLLRLRLVVCRCKKVFLDNRLSRTVKKISFGNDVALPIGMFSLRGDRVLFASLETQRERGSAILGEVSPSAESKAWFDLLGRFKAGISVAYQRRGGAKLMPDWVVNRARNLESELDRNSLVLADVVNGLCKDEACGKQCQQRGGCLLERCLEVVLIKLLELSGELCITIDMNQENIVRGVFERENDRSGHLNCIVDFLLWAIRETVLGGDVRNLVPWFMTDLYSFCRENSEASRVSIFGEKYMWRTFAPVDMMLHFQASKRLALCGAKPMDLSAMALGVAGLRQSMENRFQEIVGLKGTNAHLHHDSIPKVIMRYERELRFSNRSKTTMGCLWSIYQWSSPVVHTTVTDRIWVVWKAFDYVSNLFLPNDNGMKGGAFSIHSAIHTSVATIYKMRECLRRVVRDEECRKNDGLDVVVFQWGKPSVVFDEGQYGRDCVIGEVIGTGAAVARKKREAMQAEALKEGNERSGSSEEQSGIHLAEHHKDSV